MDTIRQALRFVRQFYADTSARDFTPKKLKALQQAMIEHKIVRRVRVQDPATGAEVVEERVQAHGLSRRYINKQVNRIKRIFAWAVEEELVPVDVHAALLRVSGLKQGRSAAREKPRVRPVPSSQIRAVLPLVPATIGAMIRVQRLCGCRPQEVVEIRAADIDRSRAVWEYRPQRFKTEHHNEDDDPDRDRVIFLGPRAQKLLKPFLDQFSDGGYLFSPTRSEAERNARRKENRKSPMTPSQGRRRPKGRARAPIRDHYDVASYRRAIRRACDKARIPIWHPNQLRHTRLTQIRKKYGLEASRVCGGHREIGVTQHYAEQDRDLAREVMNECG